MGGHVVGDMEVFTTAEIVIGSSNKTIFTREFDQVCSSSVFGFNSLKSVPICFKCCLNVELLQSEAKESLFYLSIKAIPSGVHLIVTALVGNEHTAIIGLGDRI